MHTNRTPFRSLFILVLALIGCVGANSQVVLTIDYSDLSAVKVTATGNSAAIDYPNGSSNSFSFAEGIALRNFFTAPVQVQDFVSTLTSSTFTDSSNTLTSSSTFNEISAWNDDHTEYWSAYGEPGTGNGIDITIWNQSAATQMAFSSSGPAFYGQAIFDLTAYSSYTNLFPALNATGDVRIWNNDGGAGNAVLGTWQVVGAAAVPEPATYAALFGLATLGAACWHKRRQKHA